MAKLPGLLGSRNPVYQITFVNTKFPELQQNGKTDFTDVKINLYTNNTLNLTYLVEASA